MHVYMFSTCCHFLFFYFQKFQDIEKAHLIRVKDIIGGFSHSISEVHIQIGQVCFELLPFFFYVPITHRSACA